MRVAVRVVRTRARGRAHNVASILPWGAMPESLPLPVARAGADIAGYALAVAGSAAAVIVAALAEHWVGLDDLSLVFMLAVLGVASRTHTGPAVATAVLCFLAYNFFFIEPRYTFYISAHHGVATVALFLAAAVLAGRLASRRALRTATCSRSRTDHRCSS